MKVDILLLAAGASRRMRGRDKMLELIDSETLLHRSARIAFESKVNTVHIVTIKERILSLADLDVDIIDAPANQPMSNSLAMGVANINCDAVILALADMPDITPDHYNLLISAFDPTEPRNIWRAVSEDGKAGHPVLFPCTYFAELKQISGDQGARSVIKNNTKHVHNVKTTGRSAICDLDTPEDWQNWRK